jgi:hypothetical protein
MIGWDTWEAVPIDWRLTGVFPTIHDLGEAFVYSENLWATHHLQELWVSCLGVCGHRVSLDGAAHALNGMAKRMIARDLEVGGEHPIPFDSGAVLRFRVGLPSWGRQEELEAYGVEDDAPVSEVCWSCCSPPGAAAD